MTYLIYILQGHITDVTEITEFTVITYINYIPRRKSGIYWIQVRRAAAAAAVEISLWTR